MIKMKMSNFKKFEEHLRFLQANFPSEMEQFLLDIGNSVVRATKRRTPSDTGDLKSSWKISDVERDGDTLLVTVYNDATTTYEGRTVPLAPFVEFGHKITTKDGQVTGKVDGYFMFTTSIKSINRQIPRRLRKIFDELVSQL